jgi:hypothetical protein
MQIFGNLNIHSISSPILLRMSIFMHFVYRKTNLLSAIGFTYLEEGGSEREKEIRNKDIYWLKITDRETEKLKMVKPLARSA